jgi:ribosomal subunit interface protein
MADHVVFHDCPVNVKDAIQLYWEKKQKRLEKLLIHFPDDQRNVCLSVRRHPDRFEAHAVIRLPTGSLVAQADSHSRDYQEALDLVAARLAEEIRRHKQFLRRDEGRGHRPQIPEIGPVLEDEAGPADAVA